jgi:hypothetical protein
MASEKIKAVGSKAEVFHGNAKHTSGGLTRKDLMKTKSGRIVSKKQHAAGKKAIKRLFSLGFKPKKGTFKPFQKGSVRKTRKGRKHGGAADASGNAMPAVLNALKQLQA